ncbi:cytochrome P450 [Corynespora cassiicola Philippines]|uniref:Bifunctional cytochrome P450/NADPH--P450 reductase n=1 Tax=Corynespora cassiicola Philippines TaxID=1448308 RepID=A0A2T2NPL1_CORCC|nr:cytochrome P450 [Corynespora cassiicola Philippines]
MSTRDCQVVPIPEPTGLPFLGNIGEFKSENSLKDLDRLHDRYGEIFRLRFPEGKTNVCAGSHKLVSELCDETRFKKSVTGELTEAREVTGDGLFTAKNEEENWGIAHRILMPAFGPVNIRNMFDNMHEIVSQMALKWARHGSSNAIPASEDFTRMALDVLALCSMGYRFNSFYKEEMHPFVHSMGSALIEIGKRAQRPKWASIFYHSSDRKFRRDTEVLRKTSEELIKARKADPEGHKKRDLLTSMLEGVDSRTGQKLSDESIINNLITFLVAGHETTSGTMSFAFYAMLKNPDTFQKAQKEVDEVMGREPVTVDKIFKLKYIPAVLRETLRQCSPIPGITFEPIKDELLGGKYPVKKDEPISAIFSRSHLDPLVYGEDAGQFKPERMLDENFERLQKEFPHCWKPFGNGMRACIGRPFAWQEMLLALSVLLQNFDFYLDDPSYNLKISETLTIKPKDFYMRASLRHGMTPSDLERRLRGDLMTTESASSNRIPRSPSVPTKGKQLSIFYGSNSGTCEALAQRLAASASSHGFVIAALDSLDAAKNRLPKNHPVIIFASSYEGQPPDNAKMFVSWLEGLTGNELDGVAYAVFGAGNKEWHHTYHRVPKFIDSWFKDHGAERLVESGLTDVSERDPFTDFESWEDDHLWPALETRYSIVKSDDSSIYSGLSVDVSTPRSSTLRQDVRKAIVSASYDLTAPGLPKKKHVEITLPSGTSYEPGDYLALLPMNPKETVNRVFRRFRLSWDAVLNIKGNEATPLPINTPTSASDVLSAYVELSQPATKRNVLTLASHAPDPKTKEQVAALASEENFAIEITKKRVSVLDLLERFPFIEITIGAFLSMLPPMRIRQYSISSSPLHDSQVATITYSVLEEPSFSGQGKHIGVATSYLASLKPNDVVHVAVKKSHISFHLPTNAETTPVICIAAGTGLAPFRGFVQQRAAQIEAGRSLAPALLIYGCRGRADDLYREEFDAWEAMGAVVVKRAYSREDAKETVGCKYVQDRMVKEKVLLEVLWKNGAKLFVCGSRHVGNAVEKACVELLGEFKECDAETARRELDGIRNERFATDVFD